MNLSKNTKIGLGIGAVVVVGLIAFWALQNKEKPEPEIVFKKDITFKIGQTSYESEDTDTSSDMFITPESIIIEDESKYDQISFNKIGCGNEPMTMEYRFVEATEVGKGSSELYAKLGDVCKTFTFNYTVVE